MTRKLASIKRIDNISPIPNADMIEVVTIGGWKVVVSKKDNFKVNDLVLYLEIDSSVPDLECFEFLRKNKFRIRTIKLRGQISQGIVYPLSILENFDKTKNLTIEEGMDLTNELGIVKYEAPIPAYLSGIVSPDGFPSGVPKTDEERVQNLKSIISDYKDTKFVVSEKLDGTSATFVYNDGKFSVCSRNTNWLEDDKNTYWKFAKENKIETKMRAYCIINNIKGLAIQGELIGEKIQKNRYNIKGQTVYFFNGFNIDKQKYLSHNDFFQFTVDFKLNHVPILGKMFLPKSIDNIISMADGMSILNPSSRREGLVFKSVDTGLNSIGKVSFKVISNKFLIKTKG